MDSVVQKFFGLWLVLLSANCFASNTYYPEKFWQAYQNQSIEGNELKTELHKILSQWHNPQPDGRDRVGRNCQNSQCYRHKSVGYKTARRVLFGFIHLSESDGRYAVDDVYCEKLRWEEEFFSRPPAPGRIPNHRIVNAEHTWPQSRFSRRHSRGTQKADLHALYPVDSRANSSRGNNPFGVVRIIKRQICAASRSGVSTAGGHIVFEPPDSHKGNVARSLFYFSIRYQLPIDAEEEASLRAWDQLDPVDAFELSRHETIFSEQSNRNPFVELQNLASRIDDF